MPRRRWYLTAALGLCILAVPAIFHGEVTDVLESPDPPILVGFGHDYIVVADAPTGEYMVEYRCAGDPPGGWSYPWFQSDPWFFTYEGQVGTFDLRFWAQEEPDPEGPLVWNFKEVQTTVLGPDTDEVANGLDIDSDGDLLDIYFEVLRGEDKIGGYIGGYPEEQLQFKSPSSSVWGPLTEWQAPGENFYWDEGLTMIVDKKAYDTNSAGFQALNVGDPFHDVKQRNRLVIENCEGEDEVFTFPPHHFRAIKTGQNTFKMIEIEL